MKGTFYIGKVQYLKGDEFATTISNLSCLKSDVPFNLSKQEDAVKLLFLKRKDFEYENEVRIVFVSKHKYPSNKNCDEKSGLYVKINNDILDSIKLSPDCGKETFELLKESIERKFNIEKKDIPTDN